MKYIYMYIPYVYIIAMKSLKIPKGVIRSCNSKKERQ